MFIQKMILIGLFHHTEHESARRIAGGTVQ